MPKTIQTTGTKYCKSCDTTKPIDEFYLRNKISMVRHSTCKECDKKRVSATPSIVKREQALKRMYGITHQDYEVMLEEQNNQCAICGTTDPGGRHKSNYFVVDHCHSTNKVRGVLCNNCNTSLGLVGDNISVLEEMIKYLQKHKCSPSS